MSRSELMEIFKAIEDPKVPSTHVSALMDINTSFHRNFNMGNTLLDNFRTMYTTLGDDYRGMSRMFYGINHRLTPMAISSNKNSQGLVFFTRPQLGLYHENLVHDPIMASLLNTNPLSVHRYVRCLLDPRLAFNETSGNLVARHFNGRDTNRGTYGEGPDAETGIEFHHMENDKDLICPLLDNNLIFASILTNALISCTGWPDERLPIYSSKPNMLGGEWFCADGITDIYSKFDISCTFANTQDLPILLIFYFWIRYMSLVVRGTVIPYPDHLYTRTLDYTSRIYRLILDPTKTYITMIAATGYNIPTATDIGKYFDFDVKRPYTDLNREININMTCSGVTYNSPKLIDEFNLAVCIGVPDMLNVRHQYLTGKREFEDSSGNFPYIKIPHNLIEHFNFIGYPFINYNTYELEWWTDKNHPTFTVIMDTIKRGYTHPNSSTTFNEERFNANPKADYKQSEIDNGSVAEEGTQPSPYNSGVINV